MADKNNNPLEQLVGYRLRRASAEAMGNLARELSKLGLRPTEASALVLIAANQGMTQTDIGRILDIQRANMAPLTAGLERQGLITRHRMDGRSQRLALSNAGSAVAAQALQAMTRHDQQFVAQIPDSAREGFNNALGALAPLARHRAGQS